VFYFLIITNVGAWNTGFLCIPIDFAYDAIATTLPNLQNIDNQNTTKPILI